MLGIYFSQHAHTLIQGFIVKRRFIISDPFVPVAQNNTNAVSKVLRMRRLTKAPLTGENPGKILHLHTKGSF